MAKLTEDDVIELVQNHAHYHDTLGGSRYSVRVGTTPYAADDTRELVIKICKANRIRGVKE